MRRLCSWRAFEQQVAEVYRQSGYSVEVAGGVGHRLNGALPEPRQIKLHQRRDVASSLRWCKESADHQSDPMRSL